MKTLSEYLEAIISKSQLVNDAKNFATSKHLGQSRRDGTEYIVHPKRVAGFVAKNKKSHKLKNLVAAAWLHDTHEDTDTTIEEIKEKFGELVSGLVKELSSNPEGVRKYGKTNYLKRKLLKMSDWALVIKLADRLDNVSDLRNADEKFQKKYSAETIQIIEALEKDRRLTYSQRKLINQIKKRLALLGSYGE